MIDRLVVNILEWAAGHADEGRYSPVAIVFHWTMAALMFFQLAWGWRMGRMAVGGEKAAAYEMHFAVGVLMLVLAAGRIGWRLLAPGPINDADKPGWESTAARIAHYIFYLCLFGLPLTGWALISASAAETDLRLAGVAPWPLMPFHDLTPAQRWGLEAVMEWMHWGLVVTLLALIPVHVVGALKHHFVDREDVLHGMAPVIPKPTPRRTRWQRRLRALEKALWALATGRSPRSPAATGRRRRSA